MLLLLRCSKLFFWSFWCLVYLDRLISSCGLMQTFFFKKIYNEVSNTRKNMQAFVKQTVEQRCLLRSDGLHSHQMTVFILQDGLDMTSAAPSGGTGNCNAMQELFFIKQRLQHVSLLPLFVNETHLLCFTHQRKEALIVKRFRRSPIDTVNVCGFPYSR